MNYTVSILGMTGPVKDMSEANSIARRYLQMTGKDIDIICPRGHVLTTVQVFRQAHGLRWAFRHDAFNLPQSQNVVPLDRRGRSLDAPVYERQVFRCTECPSRPTVRDAQFDEMVFDAYRRRSRKVRLS